MSPRRTLPVSLLSDGLIECGDYPGWAFARRTIKAEPYDRAILNALLESIPREGVLEPLTIGVQRWDHVPYLSDGHHRAVALAELGIKQFPYRWYWKSRGRTKPRFEKEPIPEWILEGAQAA